MSGYQQAKVQMELVNALIKSNKDLLQSAMEMATQQGVNETSLQVRLQDWREAKNVRRPRGGQSRQNTKLIFDLQARLQVKLQTWLDKFIS